MSEVKFEAGETVISRLDQLFGHHLVSVLRAPHGAVTVAISGTSKQYYGLADEDWRTMAEKGYDIWTRTFTSEGELATYLRETVSG